MTQFVYLSNALSGTISRYKLEGGKLILLGETDVDDMVMPMTISHCQNFLYAAVRCEPYRLVQFRIDKQSGDLTKESEREVDESIVSLDTDSTNKWLLAASFNQNRLRLNSLEESGRISDKTISIQHQAHCHMFRFSPDEKWMVATEFGRDKIYIYPSPQLHGLAIAPNYEYEFSKDSGPRHIVFSLCGTLLYILTEMTATVTTFTFDKEKGTLHFIAETQILPLEELGLEKGLPPANRVENDVPRVWAADIQITQNGRFLFVSERTLSVIVCLEISPNDPVPQYLNHYPVEQQPRSFMITHDDQHLLISGELADELGLYSLDSTTGKIERISSAPCGEGAAWVCATR